MVYLHVHEFGILKDHRSHPNDFLFWFIGRSGSTILKESQLIQLFESFGFEEEVMDDVHLIRERRFKGERSSGSLFANFCLKTAFLEDLLSLK